MSRETQEAWAKIIEERGLQTFEDHLRYYELGEAYKGDRGNEYYNPTLEGFARHLDTIGRLALHELETEPIPGQLEISHEE